MNDRHRDRDRDGGREAPLVTGIGAVSPLGTGAREVWRAAVAGESGIRELAEGDERLERGVDPMPAARPGLAGWVRGFRPREHVASPHLRRMDWCSRMLVAAVREAFADAGLLPIDDVLAPRVALVVGSSYGNQRETVQYLRRVLEAGPGAAQPMLFPNLVLNAGAGYAAIELGIQGPNLCVAQHEASGEAAVATALDLLRAGACDVVCAAGVDEISDMGLEALADVRLLHPDAAPPARRREAHARRRDRGMIPGEGAAAIVLERPRDARTRGADAYARVAAARVGAVPAPTYGYGSDPAATARRLLELAGAPATSLDALVGGAGGVRARQAVEREVLRRLAADAALPPGYFAPKRLAGDSGAAGALAVALAALALEAKLLPGGPTFAGLPDAPSRSAPRRILVAGLARGGVLAPIVLERADGS